jgi:NADH:ubiquinone oxidoreductase subunit E
MLELSVCIGSSCHIKGSYNVIQTFQQLIEEKALHGKINFKSDFCQNRCREPGVAVSVNHTIHRVRPEAAGEFFTAEVAPKV